MEVEAGLGGLWFVVVLAAGRTSGEGAGEDEEEAAATTATSVVAAKALARGTTGACPAAAVVPDGSSLGGSTGGRARAPSAAMAPTVRRLRRATQTAVLLPRVEPVVERPTGGKVFGNVAVEAIGVGGSDAFFESPADWMIPATRSTDVFALAGAKGRRPTANSAMF